MVTFRLASCGEQRDGEIMPHGSTEIASRSADITTKHLSANCHAAGKNPKKSLQFLNSAPRVERLSLEVCG